MTKAEQIRALPADTDYHTVAKSLGCTPRYVACIRWRAKNIEHNRAYNRQLKERRRRAAGVPTKAERFAAMQARHAWSKTGCAIERRLAKGMTYAAIADELSLSRGAVAGRTYRIKKRNVRND